VLLAGLAAAVAAASRADGQFGIFAALGVGFGVGLQRSRFCINSAFRDLIQFRSGRTMKGVLVGMAVATVGFGLHMYTLMPTPTLGPVAPEAHAVPLSAALVVGGILFGVGMVLAGGCTSGSLYRMGEGYLASWVSLGGILVGLVAVSHTWTWWWRHVIRPAPVVWFPRTLGYGGAVLLTLALLAAAYLLVLWVESRGGGAVEEVSPPPAAGSFPDALRALAASVVGRGWPAAVGGAVLGGLNVLSYTAHMPWRIVGELSRWANGAAGLVGLAPPPLEGTEDLSACTLAVGGGVLTHGLLLNVGVVAGSLLSALLAHEFKVRVPRTPVRYAQALGGGVLMGYGAGLALGCTVGAFFSAIPSLALNGWVFGASLAAGAWVGVRLLEKIP
jgi:uncharacterized membrane protein YedE/YeeE